MGNTWCENHGLHCTLCHSLFRASTSDFVRDMHLVLQPSFQAVLEARLGGCKLKKRSRLGSHWAYPRPNRFSPLLLVGLNIVCWSWVCAVSSYVRLSQVDHGRRDLEFSWRGAPMTTRSVLQKHFSTAQKTKTRRQTFLPVRLGCESFISILWHNLTPPNPNHAPAHGTHRRKSMSSFDGPGSLT